MSGPAADIARRLGENAEAVCRRYLSNGRREGHYWMVGDVHNTPGRSLYVRLADHVDGNGSAGKWTDAESGDHGDLLDIIAASCGHVNFRESLDEARRFLSLPPAQGAPRNPAPKKVPQGTPEAARKLWAASKPLVGSLADAYLTARSIADTSDCGWLRFHPHCFYRPSVDDAAGTPPAWPAMIAAVTDLNGAITGVHRTWLDPATKLKAPIAYPRRAMGHLLGAGVRFGLAGKVMAFGEGIETILSLREIAPALPLVAGLSAAHLAALNFPDPLRRLYVARDRDAAGVAAFNAIVERSVPLGIDVRPLDPRLDDFNSDLVRMGRKYMTAWVRTQMQPLDAMRLLGW